jgi:PAS domain S-box-containing protein
MLRSFARLPLKYRFAAAVSAVVAAALAAALAPLIAQELSSTQAEQALRRSTTLLLLQEMARTDLARGALEPLGSYLQRIADAPDIEEALVADASRRIVAASDPAWTGRSLPDQVDTERAGWRTVPLEHGGRRIGQLAVRFSRRAQRLRHGRTAWIAVAMAVGGASAALGVSLLLGLLLTPRLAGLTQAVRRFGAGGLEARSGKSGHDEVGTLAQAFDEMAGRVAEKQTRQAQVNALLDQKIAELKAAQDAQARSENGYRLLMQRAHDGIVVTDRELRILDANPSFCELVGYARQDLIGEPYRMLVPEEEQCRQPLTYREVHGGRDALIERRYRRKDGGQVSVELSATRVDDVRSICIVRDITERKRAEAELARREREFRQLTEEAYDGIIVLNPDNVIVDANARVAEMLAYPREALPGLSWTALVTAEDLERLPPTIGEVFAGRRKIMERRLRRSDGTVIDAEISATRVDDTRALCVLRDVTERKRAEAELARREREYRQLLEEAYDAIMIIDRAERIVDVNRSACVLLGYRRDELLGRDYGLLVESADLAQVPLRISVAFAGEPVLMERRLVHKDGAIVDVELSSKRIDEHRVQTVIRDVTERKRVEAALRESEELSRTLLSAVFDGVVIHENGVILEANPAYERMYGYAREELIGRNLLELLIAPESRQVVRDSVGVQDAHPLEGVGIRKDGRRIHFESVGKTHSYRGRRVRIASVRDITHRKEAEIALRESEARLREAQEIANLANWQWDPVTDRFGGSQELHRILGYAPEAFPANLSELLPAVHPDDVSIVRALLVSMQRRDKEQVQAEFRFQRPDGGLRHLQVRSRTVFGAGRSAPRTHGTLQDLTERKQLEHQLAQAMKMEAVGQLTGGIAHDFNNLLTILVGNLRLMERNGLKGDPLLVEAVSAAERGSGLVRHLLAFSRRQPLRPQRLYVNDLIRETVDWLQRTLGEVIVVEVHLDEQLWCARADSSQLQTALLNLALNARDAMPDGGRLIIGTANVEVQHGQHRPGGNGVTGCVRLSVTDTGVGMTPEVLEHAFDPFFTTKEVGHGSGLGLSMIYGFAEQSEGFVQIRSAPGQGTTVELYLPRAEDDAGAVPGGTQPGPLPGPLRQARAIRPANGQGHGQTILVVEDDVEVRRVTVRILQSLGYRALSVADGVEALSTLERQPDIALLLTDVVMPSGLSGIELANRARQRRPGLPVLLTTGYAQPFVGAPSAVQGPCSLLTKPYEVAELERAIGEMLPAQPGSA